MIADSIKSKQEMAKSEKKNDQSIVVEVQFCSHCDAHLFTVRHQQSKYYSHYDAIKKRLRQLNIVVRKKAVPDNLYKKSPYCPPNVFYTVESNQVVYFPEIGSFEVYLQGKKIFSKLETLKWPNPEAIAAEVEKMLSQVKIQKQINSKSEKLVKSAERHESIKKQQIVKQENKKDQFRIKSKNPDQQLTFRYSIDRRNLFKKPENNYLNRKSMTARNHQSVSQSTNRSNQTAILYKRQMNEQESIPIAQQSKKELTDEAVLQMYGKKSVKNTSNETEKQVHNNLPQIQKKGKRFQGNIYLQPIFPKSNINLQNYSRQKQIMVNKIHQQRKSYEASKQLKAEMLEKQAKINQARNSLHLKAKFNANCNQLLKSKEEKKQLVKIKEATEQNQSKQREIQLAGKNVDSKQEIEKKSSHNQLSERVKTKQSAIKVQVLPIKQQTTPINHNEIHQKQENNKTLQVKKQQQESESKNDVVPNHTENMILVNKQNEAIQQNKEEKSHETPQNKDQVNNQTTKNIQKQENNQQKPQNVQAQQAYEAQFEQQNEKNAADIENITENVPKFQQIKQQKEQPSPQVQAEKEEEKQQYDNEKFDKQQQEVQQAQKQKTNIKNTVQIPSQNVQQVVLDSA